MKTSTIRQACLAKTESRLKVLCLRFKVWRSKFKVQDSRFQIQNYKLRITNYELRIKDSFFRTTNNEQKIGINRQPSTLSPNNEQRTTNNYHQPSTIFPNNEQRTTNSHTVVTDVSFYQTDNFTYNVMGLNAIEIKGRFYLPF